MTCYMLSKQEEDSVLTIHFGYKLSHPFLAPRAPKIGHEHHLLNLFLRPKPKK